MWEIAENHFNYADEEHIDAAIADMIVSEMGKKLIDMLKMAGHSIDEEVEKNMRNGKKPTRAQRKILNDNKMNPEFWLVVKDTPYELTVRSRDTNVEKTVAKRKK